LPGPDVKAKVTAADTTESYLDSKIVVSGSVSKTVLNPGANEILQLTGLPGPDVKAKVTAADTTESYLNSKIVVSGIISKTVLNPGANETLQLSVSTPADVKAKVTAADTTESYLDSKIVVSGIISKTVLNPGANETLQLSVSTPADIKVKVTSGDTTANYLDEKLKVGTGISKIINNPGGNEEIQLACTVAAPKRYTLCFGQEDNISVDKIIPVGGSSLGFWQTNGPGYYIKTASKVIAWGIIVPAFVSNNVNHYTRFQLKTIVADGSRTTDIASASGTNLRNFDLIYGHSDGILRFYKGGGESGLSLTLNAGEMLFVVCCSATVAQARGAAIWVLCEET